MIIYKAQNKINGKLYIGQTSKTLEERIKAHLWNNQTYFQRALRKYGVQSFDWSTVDSSEDRDVLNDKEEYWISYFNSKVPNGYNITDGGDGVIGLREGPNKGRKFSKEWIEKIRKAHIGKGHPHSEETKVKLGNVRRGAILSKETKEKISKSRGGIGFPVSEETKQKIRNTWATKRGISCL